METHVIRKEDLLEMLSRFDNKSHVVIQAGSQPLYIDQVEYSAGQININCHNDIEDEYGELEQRIHQQQKLIEKTRSAIGLLIHRLQMRDDRAANNVELTVQELNEIKEPLAV